MLTRAEAEEFARDWAAAWNDRDLAAVLAHYSEDVVFHSPRIAAVMACDARSISGKPALKAYWRKALDGARELFFEVDRVLVSADALTILYTNHREQSVAETFVFNRAGKVILSVAAYE